MLGCRPSRGRAEQGSTQSDSVIGEADEVTYNLHIINCHELERAMVKWRGRGWSRYPMWERRIANTRALLRNR